MAGTCGSVVQQDLQFPVMRGWSDLRGIAFELPLCSRLRSRFWGGPVRVRDPVPSAPPLADVPPAGDAGATLFAPAL